MSGSRSELEESNTQFIEAWKGFARALPSGAVEELPGLVAAITHTPMPLLNMILVSSPLRDLADLERRARVAVERGAKSGVPWLFSLCEDWVPADPDSVRETLAKVGLRPELRTTGMVADALSPPRREAAGVELRPVADAETREAVADLNCVCYGMPLSWGRVSVAREEFWVDGSFGQVGYVDGRPVTTATTVAVDGRLYLAFVATAPDHRKKGLAEAVIRRSLEVAGQATGLHRMVLHATDLGRPVYARMGYRDVAGFTWYALPAA